MQVEQDTIIIKETIDGLSPSEEALRRQKRAGTTREEGRKKSDILSGFIPRRKADPYILGIYLVFIVVSLIEIFSASSTEVKAADIYGPLKRHAVFLFLGMGIVYAIQRVHYGYLRKFAWAMAIGSLGLLILVSVIGETINGAQRAITIAGFTIQPAEIAKYTLVILLAKILSDNQLKGGVRARGVFWVAFMVLVFSALLWVNGLTNMVLLMGVSLAMFLIGNIEFKKLLVVAVVYGACGGIIYMSKYSGNGATQSEFDKVSIEKSEGEAAAGDGVGRAQTHQSRISAFKQGVAPTDSITDENRQVWFSKMAQAHGGVLGRGPGNSRESARLPLAFSDYIFSIVVEDSGLVGGTVLLTLYLFLVARAGVIAYRVRKAFPAFLIMGCAVMIVLQALVHMAIVVGLVPVSGQPLPFISKGGTSILVMSAAIGTMLSVSRFAVYRSESLDPKESKNEEQVDGGLDAATVE